MTQPNNLTGFNWILMGFRLQAEAVGTWLGSSILPMPQSHKALAQALNVQLDLSISRNPESLFSILPGLDFNLAHALLPALLQLPLLIMLSSVDSYSSHS